MITDLTTETFDQAVAGPGIAVVDFWAPWCGPCHLMALQLEPAAQAASAVSLRQGQHR